MQDLTEKDRHFKYLPKKNTVLQAIYFFSVLNVLAYFISPSDQPKTDRNFIGQVTWQENDTRYKSAKESQWQQSREHQRIFQEDLIYTGRNSWTEIHLKTGLKLALAAESVAQFGVKSNFDILNFGHGQFNLKISNFTKFLVRGKSFDAKGDEATLQIYDAPNEEVYFKVVRGHLEYKLAGTTAPVVVKEGEISYPFRVDVPAILAQSEALTGQNAPESDPQLALENASTQNEKIGTALEEPSRNIISNSESNSGRHFKSKSRRSKARSIAQQKAPDQGTSLKPLTRQVGIKNLKPNAPKNHRHELRLVKSQVRPPIWRFDRPEKKL